MQQMELYFQIDNSLVEQTFSVYKDSKKSDSYFDEEPSEYIARTINNKVKNVLTGTWADLYH